MPVVSRLICLDIQGTVSSTLLWNFRKFLDIECADDVFTNSTPKGKNVENGSYLRCESKGFEDLLDKKKQGLHLDTGHV